MIIILIIIVFGVLYFMTNQNTAKATTQPQKATTTPAKVATTATKTATVTNSSTWFNQALKTVFNTEGGFNPNDPGGGSMMGVLQDTYNNWQDKHNLPRKLVKQITKQEATDIYYNWYWIPSQADHAKTYAMALLLFDTAVNCGVGASGTIHKRAGDDPKKFIEARLAYYKTLGNYSTYAASWKNRLANLSRITGAGAVIV